MVGESCEGVLVTVLVLVQGPQCTLISDTFSFETKVSLSKIAFYIKANE